MKQLINNTTSDPPGNGLDSDLPALTETVLGMRYGETIAAAEYSSRLRKCGCDYYEALPGAGEEEKEQFLAFVDELFRLKPVVEDNRPLAFEQWLAAAVEAFIDTYELEDDRQRFLFETEWWGLVPSDAAERKAGMPLTRQELKKAMAALPKVRPDVREYVKAGRNDLRPFRPNGDALTPKDEGMVMLRRLGILPADWDHIYGSIVERVADDFCRQFYPVFRWIVMDPDEVCLFSGERVDAELLPGFQDLFADFLREVLTVATNQVLRYAQGDGPGAGPGMREFAWTTAEPGIDESPASTNEQD